MIMMRIEYNVLTLPLLKPFTISRAIFHDAKVVRVRVTARSFAGAAECVPQARFGETIDSVVDQIKDVQRLASASSIDREQLSRLLPAGAARNAIDCALWDLEAKTRGQPVWHVAGLRSPIPVLTAYTLPLTSPDQTFRLAKEHAHRPLLKVKVGTPDDATRLRAIRAGAPQTRIIVDANEAWTIGQLDAMAPLLESAGVEIVEQPLPAGDDDALRDRNYRFAICADEGCRERSSLKSLLGKYGVISIKLDKVGGLTEALALRSAALKANFRVMVGCGIGSTLAIAPAVLVAQGAAYVDLDGPLFLREDIPGGIQYSSDHVAPADPNIWG